jgi:hypothetical protein
VLCVAADEEEKEAVDVEAQEYCSPPPRLVIAAALPPPPIISWLQGLRKDGSLSSLGRRGRHPNPASTTGAYRRRPTGNCLPPPPPRALVDDIAGSCRVVRSSCCVW